MGDGGWLWAWFPHSQDASKSASRVHDALFDTLTDEEQANVIQSTRQMETDDPKTRGGKAFLIAVTMHAAAYGRRH